MLKCRVEFWAVILLLGMVLSGFAEKGDLDSVFLTRELSRTEPDYVIYTLHAEAKYDDYGNEHLHVFRLKDGALGDCSDHERGELAIQYSDDAGETWTDHRVIEADLNGWQCYVACREVKGNLLLGYCLKQNLAWSRLTFYPGTK